jgi:FdhD protein
MTAAPGTVPETNWNLVVNGRRMASGTASPGAYDALAAGLLVAEGFVRERDELLGLEHHEDPYSVTLQAHLGHASFERGIAERAHREERGCNLMHFVACEPELLKRVRTAAVPAMDGLAERLRDLFDACSTASPGGGVHAAAIVTADATTHTMVDVSRHAAVHKAAGSAFLERIDPSAMGLALTARVSGLISLTAARAGFGWIVSRSVPTTLAVAIANAAGLPIVVRAGSRDAVTISPTVGRRPR